jgi:hypothetical protein
VSERRYSGIRFLYLKLQISDIIIKNLISSDAENSDFAYSVVQKRQILLQRLSMAQALQCWK